MRRINYKSDIPPLLLSLKVDENQITVPDFDFIVRFYIEGYEGRHYDCSHIGGVWSNCEPSEDGTKLVCYINNQRLGIGELCAEFNYISPDRRYSDGSQKSVVIIGSTELGVELVEDNGDAVTEAAIDVTLPFIYRTAYEIARDHGYTGTAEDFYGALASVVGIADAEKKRVTAEITRNANEQERIENEENRLNAENGRVNAEAQRVRNEAIRSDAESDRVEQEEDRKAKFGEITEFIATVRANEGNRESNERERQANEDTRITEEAKRVEAEKKRAAEFEQQKLDLTGKIDRSGDEMGGDLIFTDNAGVSFRTSNGGAHTMFNDTDDVAKFTADNGDTFEFKQNETPNKNSSAVVVSKNLYNALDMTLESMGSALDGDTAYRAEAGDKIFNPDTCKIQIYNSTIGGFEDLCDPIDGKLYSNKLTGYIYRWEPKAKKMVFVGGVKAYTKDEADSRFAKLKDETQTVNVKELNANNFVYAKSMWIGDEGLILGGDGNGHLTVEQDEVITDVTLNEKLATKADDVAYGVEWNNGQPTGEMQETTIKDATKNTTVATLYLAQSYNALESEVEKKVNKTDIVQSTGTSTTAVMSQKAVSDKMSEMDGKVDGVVEGEKSFEDAIRDQVNNYKPIVIEGNVTNAADEEDLTSENGLLKIKNRSSLNGMGYVILRKGKTFAEQITKENTIYEIRYNFDLDGEEVEIPANCVLKFNGGKLTTGGIVGNHTKIVAADYLIFDFGVTHYRGYTNTSNLYSYVSSTSSNDVAIKGTWDNVFVKPSWVGLNQVEDNTDIRPRLQKYLDLHNQDVNIVVPKNKYYCYGSLNVNTSVDFCGSEIICCKYSDIYDGTIVLPESARPLPEDDIYGLEMCYGLVSVTRAKTGQYLKNLTIDGNRDNNYEAARLGISGLLAPWSKMSDFLFENLILKNSPSCGFIGGAYSNNIVFKNIKVEYIGEHGYYGNDTDSKLTFINSSFHNIGDSARIIGLRRGSSYIIKDMNITDSFELSFDGCHFSNNAEIDEYAWLNVEAGNIYVRNCVFENKNMILASGSNSHLRTIVVENTTNSFSPNNNTYINTEIRYIGCKGKIYANNAVKHIKDCDVFTEYNGTPNVSFVGDFASKSLDPIVIENTTLNCYRSETITRFNDWGAVKKIMLDRCTIIAHPANYNRLSIFVAKLISGQSSFEVAIQDSDILLSNGAVLCDFGQIIDLTIERCNLMLRGGYALRVNRSVTINDIRIYGGVLCDGTIGSTLNVIDNTQRSARYSKSDSNRQQDCNFMGILTTVADTTSEISAIKFHNAGSQVFNITEKRPVWFNGTKLIDENGNTFGKKKGETSSRPTLTSSDAGYLYFDTTLAKPIWWTGSAWVDATGANVVE